jgi:recombination protein RecT
MADSQVATTGGSLTITKLVKDEGFQKEAEKTLGAGAPQFLSSVLTLANSDPKIRDLDPIKLYNTCLMAAALKLPFNSNLGQAYIIPYKGEPQLQIGWKGFVQLAQRSGQFKTIGVNPVHENEIAGIDSMTGEIMFDFKLPGEKSGKIVGYMAYFRLLNGFEKSLYMTMEELEKHALKYSQTYKRKFGVWVDNFEAMAQKTVIKLLLNRFAPLSINSELARAIEIDQSDDDGNYADNKPKVSLTESSLGVSETDKKENADGSDQ